MQPALITELKARREKLGWSIKDVARRCGIDESLLQNWERGIGSPTLNAAQHWAACLGLELLLSGAQHAARRGVSIDWDKRCIAVHGTPVRLTPMEWKALERLAKVPGELVTHEALFRHLYGDAQPYRAQSTAIRVLITKLRRLLPLRIEARWGRGYLVTGIEPPPAEQDRMAEKAAERPGEEAVEKRPLECEPLLHHRPVREIFKQDSLVRDAFRRDPPVRDLPERDRPVRTPDMRLGVAGDRAYPQTVRPVPRVAVRAAPPGPCRAEELDVIERFLAERGVTRCPDVATIQRSPLPTLVWDKTKRKWVRPAVHEHEAR